jgi:hypothetical protein
MPFLKSLLDKFMPKRKPAEIASLVSVTGALMIATNDGAVVITPQVGRQLLNSLPQAIREAESLYEPGL